MKISIAIQYYNRREQFINTLNSIKNTEHKDIEVIIIDDASSEEHSIDDVVDRYPEMDISIYKFKEEDKWWSCPVYPINKGIAMAKGDIIILLCAECMLVGDVISDSARINTGEYFVYSTYALSEGNSKMIEWMSKEEIERNPFAGAEGGLWYQHSQHNQNCYNFCVALRREDMERLGGFEERYAVGYHSGDVDFINRVRKILDVKMIDYPMSYHQHHESFLFNEFYERSKKEERSNIGGAALTKYLAANEPDRIKAINSFLENEEYIPPAPVLKSISEEIEIEFIVGRVGSTTHIDFRSDYTSLIAEVFLREESGESFETFIQSGSYMPIQCEYRNIEIWLKGNRLFSERLEEGFDQKIEIKTEAEILTHF